MSRWFSDYQSGGAFLDDNDRSVVCLGNFDGVHRGHRSILMRALDEAKRRRFKSIVFTFSPHPTKILKAGEGGVDLLLNPEEKKELLDMVGFDVVINQRFDRDFTLITAENFAGKILRKDLKCAAVVVGDNFHFGYRAQGNAQLLSSLKIFDVFAAEAISDSTGQAISSTRIRQAVSGGHVEIAEELLGYPYFISGRVVHGDGRGKTLGFPTLNVSFQKECVPSFGVYAAFVRCKDVVHHAFPAAVNWGMRPTVDGSSPTLEAHLLNESGNFYGKDVRVFFKKKIREEMKFESVEDLKTQIALDLEAVRKELHGQNEPLTMLI